MSCEISVVITVFNEEENIKPLIERLESSLKDIDHEVLFVDDGSSDNTIAEIEKHGYEGVKVVVLERNFGQTAAMAAGIEHAVGKYIVTMDGDLQNDPSDIPGMYEKLITGGYDVITGIREKRQDNVIRKIPSKIANFIIRQMSGVHIHDYGCSLKIYKTKIAKNLGLYGELHRFIPILAKMQGARISDTPVKHHPRIFGSSKYGLGRTFKVASDLILLVFFQKYMRKPMHFFGTLGILSTLVGFIINLYLLALKIIGQDIWGRPLLILGVILFIGGIQLISTGFLAEMIIRTYFESQNKRIFQVNSVLHAGKSKKITQTLP